jgi:metal-responsive CopG/Arc/MetJ family transcriptional regulator
MDQHLVVMKLNQQQLELLDRTIARGVAPDRTTLVLTALREYAKAHQNDAHKSTSEIEGENHE